MRTWAVALFAAAVASTTIAREYRIIDDVSIAAQIRKPKLGTYACTVHRAVGIQGDATAGKRSAGPLTLPPEKAVFTMVLGVRATDDTQGPPCATFPPDKTKPMTTNPAFGSDLEYWYACRSAFSLKLSPAKESLEMRGEDRNAFHGPGTFPQFHLYNDLAFVHTYTNFSGDWYVEEGQCRQVPTSK